METEKHIIEWLLAGDPAIRWQTYQFLSKNDSSFIEKERNKTANEGWGNKLLSFQDESGLWGGSLYSNKWISTTYTLLLLKRLGLPHNNIQAERGCRLLLEKGLYNDGGINVFGSLKHSETCVTGIVLSIISYFHYKDDRVSLLADFLINQQMKDGGWNCQSFNGAVHSSFHTTISVLEGLLEYQKNINDDGCISGIQKKGIEFLLQHRLFKSHRTGKIVKSEFTRFSFPPRWYYDILRALDYIQEFNADKDERMNDAIDVVKLKRKPDGTWLLQNRHPGKTFFEMEEVGKPSRWNTLRALRVLKWWDE